MARAAKRSIQAMSASPATRKTRKTTSGDQAGTTTEHPFAPGSIGSEFVFVRAAEDAGEDEGWLLGYVYDGARGASDLLILDAHDFGADPVATVHLPARVPQGFHGNWVPDSALG